MRSNGLPGGRTIRRAGEEQLSKQIGANHILGGNCVSTDAGGDDGDLGVVGDGRCGGRSHNQAGDEDRVGAIVERGSCAAGSRRAAMDNGSSDEEFRLGLDLTGELPN